MFSEIVTARVRILLKHTGVSMNEASRRLGHHFTWLRRPLNSGSLKLTDAQQVVQALGLDPAILAAPVLIGEDRKILREIARARKGLPIADIASASLERLRDQALIEIRDGRALAAPGIDPDAGIDLEDAPLQIGDLGLSPEAIAALPTWARTADWRLSSAEIGRAAGVSRQAAWEVRQRLLAMAAGGAA